MMCSTRPETIVAEVMRPRADVVFIEGDQPLAEAAAFVRDQPYSRYPVTGKDFDDVIGFVHVRDLLDVRDPNAKIVRDVVREGISLPGTSKLLPSLELLRKRGIHLAVVIDEYGGTDGIVTLEDMTEELVGDIRDEYDLPSEKGGERTTRTAFVNGVATIEASMTIEDFADLTGIELEDGPYETVAGYFLSKTGKMGSGRRRAAFRRRLQHGRHQGGWPPHRNHRSPQSRRPGPCAAAGRITKRRCQLAT